MVAEKMVIVNGARVPLSAIKPQEKSEEKSPKPTPAPVEIEVDKEHPLLPLHIRLTSLKEDGDLEKLDKEYPEFEEQILKIKKKADLLGVAELLAVEADDKMKMAQIRDLILLPLQAVEDEPENDL